MHCVLRTLSLEEAGGAVGGAVGGAAVEMSAVQCAMSVAHGLQVRQYVLFNFWTRVAVAVAVAAFAFVCLSYSRWLH